MECQLKVEAAVFDLRLAKGCVDVAEQDCCRLPLLLTLHMTIRSKPRTVALQGCLEIHHKIVNRLRCPGTEQSNEPKGCFEYDMNIITLFLESTAVSWLQLNLCYIFIQVSRVTITQFCFNPITTSQKRTIISNEKVWSKPWCLLHPIVCHYPHLSAIQIP